LNRPFFSIVLPTYNSVSTISTALDSILSQSYRELELIIIDGLSSDRSSKVIGDYAALDSRIIYISEADEGIYDAMNKGIKQAVGEWIYFIGSDDNLYDQEVLKTVFESIRQHSHGKVYYGNVIISGDTNWARDGEVYDGPFNIQKLMTKNICHQSVFYNTDFIKREIGMYNKKYAICADWDFNLRCWSRTEFIYIELKVAKFNAGGESTKYREDVCFTNDLVPNILSYFNISPFDDLINHTQFPQSGKLMEMQKKKSYFHYVFDRIKKKMTHH
jgi:glycosyltransferase involved in cell wall biosynthesis